MEIPKGVKILGHKYSVEIKDRMFLRENNAGRACANTLEITLAGGLPESRGAEAFLHEIIEMLKYTLQVDIKHEDLSALSEGLFSVIRDNRLDFRGGV